MNKNGTSLCFNYLLDVRMKNFGCRQMTLSSNWFLQTILAKSKSKKARGPPTSSLLLFIHRRDWTSIYYTKGSRNAKQHDSLCNHRLPVHHFFCNYRGTVAVFVPLRMILELNFQAKWVTFAVGADFQEQRFNCFNFVTFNPV
ncbi:hypothetical protein ACTXT7_003960 [Hymenolepis weldensis]